MHELFKLNNLLFIYIFFEFLKNIFKLLKRKYTTYKNYATLIKFVVIFERFKETHQILAYILLYVKSHGHIDLSDINENKICIITLIRYLNKLVNSLIYKYSIKKNSDLFLSPPNFFRYRYQTSNVCS